MRNVSINHLPMIVLDVKGGSITDWEECKSNTMEKQIALKTESKAKRPFTQVNCEALVEYITEYASEKGIKHRKTCCVLKKKTKHINCRKNLTHFSSVFFGVSAKFFMLEL